MTDLTWWELLVVSWIMLNGLGLVVGMFFRNPFGFVAKLNLWLIVQIRSVVGEALIWSGYIVHPKKKRRRGP